MPKNLVIVGVAGQGADDRALPRRRLPGPRLVRPRPRPAREPGQGQVRRGRRPRLRARVRHHRGSPQAGRGHREGRPGRRTGVWLATDLDREGEAIAWHVAEAAGVPAAKTRRVTFNEITEPAIRGGVRQPARHRHGPRRRAAGAPDRRPARRLHAEPADVPQGPRRPVSRSRPVGRRPARRRARARDPRLHRPRVLDARGACCDGRGRARSRPSVVRIDGEAARRRR